MNLFCRWLCGVAVWLVPGGWLALGEAAAQDADAAGARTITAESRAAGAGVPEPATRSAQDATIFARRDARTITQRIPPPRGLILDREGEAFANNRVAYQVALQFRQFEEADRDFVVQWARTRLDTLQGLLPGVLTKSDDELHEHYRHRRWLPLAVSGSLDEKAARSLEAKLPAGLVLHPFYCRNYPHNELAAHVIGYTGSVGKLPTGPILFHEPMWEESEGRAGFELLFDKELTGEPGSKRLLFDEFGNKLLEEQTRRPRPGGTLVTSLNLKWQKLAENVLRGGCRRGAFVVIDAITGEVLVLASRPAFDLNAFIPSISEKDYEALEKDPARPMHGRAFRSGYPPASAYKPFVALAALNNGVVTETSTVHSPAALTIGNHTFRNWSSTPEGSINVNRALARSTNTWFYQVGIDTGPHAFLSLSRRFGFGETTGLPLVGETPGLVPNDEYMRSKHRRRILDGDTANLSIGQGDLLATPLQVAQAMAGIANGGVLPKLSLVRQVQDSRGRVIRNFQPERRNWLGVDAHAIEVVREGMKEVVHSGYGTGRSAALSFTTLAGKTGTAQWGQVSRRQRLAWFAGFLPHDNPRYAFAVLYEGQPGETVSGGRMAAPMVRKFFEPLKEDIKETIAPPAKALVVVEEGTEPAEAAEPIGENPAGPDGEVLRALPVEVPETAPELPRALPVEEPGGIIDDGLEEP